MVQRPYVYYTGTWWFGVWLQLGFKFGIWQDEGHWAQVVWDWAMLENDGMGYTKTMSTGTAYESHTAHVNNMKFANAFCFVPANMTVCSAKACVTWWECMCMCPKKLEVAAVIASHATQK